MSKVCKICGAKLPEDDNFCIICNKFVDGIDESEVGLDRQESAFAVYNKPTSVVIEKKSKLGAIFFAIIGIAIIIGTIYYFSNLKNFQYQKIVEEYYVTIFENNEVAYKDLVLPELVEGDNYRVEKKFLDIKALSGSNNLEYKIDKAKKVDSSDVDILIGNINKISGKNIKLSGVYEIDVTISKTANDVPYTDTIYVVKSGGKQYIYFE